MSFYGVRFRDYYFMEVKQVKKFISVLLAVLLVFCGSAVAADKEFVVGVNIFNVAIPFYANFIKGLEDGAQLHGLKYLLRDGQGDPNIQVGVIQQFIAEKVDLIIIVPIDAQVVVPVIAQANAAGIPVVAANNKVGEGASIVTFVGADDFTFGQQQGQLLIDAIGTKGNVGYLMGVLGTSAQVLRKEGLLDFLKAYPDIKIVGEIGEDWDSAKALAGTQDMLSRLPKGELDAIICQGPEAVASARYAVGAGRTEVKWILGDYPQDVRQAIREGIVYGTVNQDPYVQAVGSMEVAKLYLTGRDAEIVKPNFYSELPLVTKENVEQYEAVW